MTLILSLFPGLGLLDRGFEEVWTDACIVRGPDALWGGDIKRFHAPSGKFDGVIGGPPCKAFSRLQHIVTLNRNRELEKNPQSNKYAQAENLIPEFVRLVEEAKPTWFLMENVTGVPESEYPHPAGYQVSSFILNARWVLDATAQNRERRFWFGHQKHCIDLRQYMDFALFEPVEWEYAVTAAGSGGGAPVPVRYNSDGQMKAVLRLPKNRPNSRSVADYLRLQGLPEEFFGKDAPFTVAGKRLMLGNGVPVPMGRAVAKAIQCALVKLEGGAS